jgi:hypothetical protein
MLLFVGLGNPGSRYAGNRHNIGFMVVDAIARRHGITPWRRRFQGVSAEGPLGGERVLLLLPGTYMNESGRAVAEAAHFYKLGVGDIVVFHDEIDLAPAKFGEGGRRHRRAQRLALDLRACRQRLSPRAHLASVILASRIWCIRTVLMLRQERAAVGRGAVRRHRRQCRAAGEGPGRKLPRTRSTSRLPPRASSTRSRQNQRLKRRRQKKIHERPKWDSNAASSACPMSASRRSSMR